MRLRLQQKQVDLRLRIVTGPSAQDRYCAWSLGEGSHKSSYCDVYVMVMKYIVSYKLFWN